MKPRSGWRWVRLLAGVVLPLLAGVLAAPATARGSCGDYVMLGGPHAAETHPPPPAGSQDLPATPQPRPCSGPSCRQHAPEPLPATPVAPVPVEDRCCPPAPPQLDDSRACARLAQASCPKPSRSPSTVYHPPRPSAF